MTLANETTIESHKLESTGIVCFSRLKLALSREKEVRCVPVVAEEIARQREFAIVQPKEARGNFTWRSFLFDVSRQIACCRDTDYIFISMLVPIYIGSREI